MSRFSFKIAFSIIVSGLFVVIAIAAVSYDHISPGMAWVLGILIAYIFLFGMAMGKNFSLPVKELIKRADGLSKGDIQGKIYVAPEDEIGELTQIFNKIAGTVQKNQSEVESLKKSADIKVKTKTILSEQVIAALEQKVKNRTAQLEQVMQENERLRQKNQEHEQELHALRTQAAQVAVKKPRVRKPNIL